MAVCCPGHGGDYCDTEVFRAECSDGEVIVIERALYGRMKLGRCVEQDIGYLGCHRDVIGIADRRCSGRRVCEIRIPDAEFESTRACLKELKTYLEVVYRCVTRT
jgi:Galactose binding lectin domain